MSFLCSAETSLDLRDTFSFLIKNFLRSLIRTSRTYKILLPSSEEPIGLSGRLMLMEVCDVNGVRAVHCSVDMLMDSIPSAATNDLVGQET